MNTFRVIPRAKKYWVEIAEGDAVRKVIKAFTTEDAALRYAREMQRVADRAGLSQTTPTRRPSEGR